MLKGSSARLVEGEGAVELTGGHRRQESAHLGRDPASRTAGTNCVIVARKGPEPPPGPAPRAQPPAPRSPTEAAEVDVDGERRPAQPAELAAGSLGFSAADGYLPTSREGTHGRGASAVAEQLLVRELEVHDVPLLS